MARVTKAVSVAGATHRHLRHPQLLLRHSALLQPRAQFLRSDGVRRHMRGHTEGHAKEEGQGE